MRIERVGDRVVITASALELKSSRDPHEIAIDARTGLFDVDGVTYLKGCNLGTGAIVCDLYDGDYAVSNECVLREAASMLGVSTEEISRLAGGFELGWSDIAIMNRFVGYPEAFYENALHIRGDASILFGGPCNLPRTYQDLVPFFDLCGFPSSARIKRLAFQQPMLISLALLCPQLPSSDEGVLYRLMSHPYGVAYFEEIASGFGTAFWRYAAHLVGEEILWDWAFAKDSRELRRYGLKLKPEPREYYDYDSLFRTTASELGVEGVMATATEMMNGRLSNGTMPRC